MISINHMFQLEKMTNSNGKTGKESNLVQIVKTNSFASESTKFSLIYSHISYRHWNWSHLWIGPKESCQCSKGGRNHAPN